MKISSTEQPQPDGIEVLSSEQIGWSGILVQHVQAPANHICEHTQGALLAHWLSFPSVQPIVIKQRVERAKLLLETTDLPISNIAAQVGFANSSHLTHHCKRQTGMTPRQIANNR
jgi:AraC-like DNA-binding protein